MGDAGGVSGESTRLVRSNSHTLLKITNKDSLANLLLEGAHSKRFRLEYRT